MIKTHVERQLYKRGKKQYKKRETKKFDERFRKKIASLRW